MNELVTVQRLREDQEELVNAIIESKGANLPASIGDLTEILMFSKGKMDAFSSLSKSTKGIRGRVLLNRAALASGQRWAAVYLYGQAAIGAETRKIKGPVSASKSDRSVESVASRAAQLVEAGISATEDNARHRAAKAELLDDYPGVIEEVIAEAEADGDIASMWKATAKARAIIKANRSDPEPDNLDITIEEQNYLIALDRMIRLCPKEPPSVWHDQPLKEATAKAEIILGRLEHFYE